MRACVCVCVCVCVLWCVVMCCGVMCGDHMVHLLCRYNKRHVAFKLAYLGPAYHGFAIQEETGPTIEVQ